MNDLIDLPDLGDNTPEFSVSEISMGIKKLIETKFDYIRVKGEFWITIFGYDNLNNFRAKIFFSLIDFSNRE